MPKPLLSLILSMFFFSPLLESAADPLFPDEGHCVAYKTRKTFFLVRTVDVVGKNCSVSSQIIPEVGGQYYFELRVPTKSFESGESERDRDVAKILKAEKHKDMVFRTSSWPQSKWEELLKSKSFTLEGKLTIAGKAYPVSAQVEMVRNGHGVVANGLIYSKFKHFGIEPPKLGMGVVAKVRDKLDLYFQLRADKTLGVDQIVDLTTF
ncbi:MAG: YceI family protein [Bdellovibrionales bacterium]|nr:YceI family protein [Bdellovibrionales bacterium]